MPREYIMFLKGIKMSDYLVRATAAKGKIRAFAVTTKDTVNKAAKAHDTSPVVTAALGRLLSAGLMMGSMMKNEKDTVTLKVEGNGPIKSIMVKADANGNVKGYPSVPRIPHLVNDKGKLDVAGGVGVGLLTVIKDIGLKEPYNGTCELVTSEIAEDLTYYFAASKQTSSSVGLGVLVDRDESVKEAGGFIVQLMPDITEEEIIKLEEALGKVTSVTAMLSEGLTPEGILERLLGDLDLEILDTMPVQFHCDCSKEKVCSALVLLNENDINSIIEDGQPIEVMCHFCNTAYKFDLDELKEIQNKKI